MHFWNLEIMCSHVVCQRFHATFGEMREGYVNNLHIFYILALVQTMLFLA